MSIQSNFPNLKPTLLLDFANTKQLDSRVTFTRSTPAVYYDGKTTAMAEQNIFQQSQTFDNAYWIKYTGTITANSTTAPDGTSTADTFTEASGSVLPCFYVNAGSKQVNETFTLSVYAKANGRNYIWLKQRSGTNDYIVGIYDLSAPSVSKTQAGTNDVITSTSITSVGNGWYRLTLTGYLGGVSNGETLFGLSDTGTPTIDAEGNITAYTGNGTSGAYFWGAQFEARSTATAYTPTTTQPITNYIPVLLTAGGNQPRFDCNPTTGESLGLLIEEQRTNIVTNSNVFTSGWTYQNMTVTGDTAISPDGTLTADKAILTAVNNYHSLYQAITYVSGNTYTYSLYAKAGELTQLILSIDTGFNATGANAVFNLSTGVVTSSSAITTATITSVGNGWYRCAISAPCTGSGATLTYIVPTNSGGAPELGNAWNGLYIWGIQIEVGAFATSYIATTSASATRTLDSATITDSNFSSWYNQAEGTLYAEASPQTASSGSYGIAGLTSDSSANSISVYYTGGTLLDVETLVNNSVQYTFLVARGSPPSKVAHGYKVNDSNVALNGTSSTTDTVCLIPTVNTLLIGSIYTKNGFPCNGTIRKIAYYPLRVTNAQLAALTS